ncbi:MAG: M23 family metallopeptidase, partial [Sulfurimonas sp.]|nr:M23 family metallopeptidase [Sulfurimonas sp.]
STYNSFTKDTKKKKVNLEAIDIGNYIVVNIQNLNPYSVTVNVKESYKNLKYNKAVKNILSLKSNEKKEYIRLYKQKGALSYSYNYRYSWIIGSLNAVHDESYVYRLPYSKGKSYMVTQGFNGKATHQEHSQYAIDFGMPEGTKICAAREGTVVKTKENSNKGGYDKKFSSFGNHITIEHSDCTFSTYYHLKKNGVLVKIGQKIDRGEIIGYSGNTGYSSGPHLHFAVFKANSATTTKTIPIRLLGEKGIINIPQRGKYYVAK